MRFTQRSTLGLALAFLVGCAAFGQSSTYGPPHDPAQNPYDRQYGDDRGGPYDHRDDGYSDYGRPTDPRYDVGFFYDELSLYGDWMFTRSYGWVWFPRNVHPYWRPYVEGRWVVTDYGWTWASYEPFGWATYHYGRWTWDPRFGWLWVPGTDWGPAWVSWQSGGGYIGWAPLPPAVGFEIGFGIRLGNFDISIGIRSDAYSFVSERSFLDSRVARHLIPTARNVTIIHNTTNITNYTYVDNRVYNRGVDIARIERATGRNVERLRVVDSRDKTRAEVAGDAVRIYRPEPQRLGTVHVRTPDRGVDDQGNRRPTAATRPVPVGPGVRPSDTHQRPNVSQGQRPPTLERRPAEEVEVAPRIDLSQRPNARQIEKRESEQRAALERHQRDEKRTLDTLHQQEDARARAQADRAEVEKRHQAERAAMVQGQQDAARQLEARQKAQRRAEAIAPTEPAADPAADRRNSNNRRDKPKKDKKDSGHDGPR